MHARRQFLATLGTTGLALLAGCSGQSGSSAQTTPAGADDGLGSFALTSPAFEADASIPTRYTCDGADVSPPLDASLPDAADTVAVVVTDPDAPGGTFTHWLAWNLPPDVSEDVPTEETVPSLDDAKQGTNDFGDIGYGAPCPPEGDGPHTYVFTAYAVQGVLSVEAGADRQTLEAAIAESEGVVGRGTLRAHYER